MCLVPHVTHPRLPTRVPSDRVPSSVGCPTRVAFAARVDAATHAQGKPKRPIGCRPIMEVAGVWRGMWKRLRDDVCCVGECADGKCALTSCVCVVVVSAQCLAKLALSIKTSVHGT